MISIQVFPGHVRFLIASGLAVDVLGQWHWVREEC